MTANEKKALTYLIASTEHPSLPSHSYPEGIGGKMVIHNSEQNIKRLLDSPDFRAGWNACRNHFQEVLEFLQTGTPKEIRQYAKQSLG
jgi:hypothetical protein